MFCIAHRALFVQKFKVNPHQLEIKNLGYISSITKAPTSEETKKVAYGLDYRADVAR